MKKFIATTLAAAAMVSCSSPTATTTSDEDNTRVLVLYYSQTGVTQKVAQELQTQLGADIEAIEIENPYDGTYDETIERCKKEMEEGVLPVVKPLKSDLTQYDVIFVGYPVWFGTYAPPIASLVKQIDFAGKKVVTFSTFGSGGLQASTLDLKKALPNAEVVEGYGVRTLRVDAAATELNRFLIEAGFKQGEIEPLPHYADEHPVTDADVATFDKACGDYQFPLGTPVTVSTRTTATGTDYYFTATSKGLDGKDVESHIYVTAPTDGTPYFTQVVR